MMLKYLTLHSDTRTEIDRLVDESVADGWTLHTWQAIPGTLTAFYAVMQQENFPTTPGETTKEPSAQETA